MYEEQDAQRAELVRWLGQCDGVPWLTDEQLAALVNLSVSRVRNLLRTSVRHDEVLVAQVDDTYLYALPERLPLDPLPDFARTESTVLAATR
jgi:hypothetical protein